MLVLSRRSSATLTSLLHLQERCLVWGLVILFYLFCSLVIQSLTGSPRKALMTRTPILFRDSGGGSPKLSWRSPTKATFYSKWGSGWGLLIAEKNKENWLMKNKNIKNKPQNYGRWLFLHSRFSKIFRGRTPETPIKNGIHQLNPQNLFEQQSSSQRQKKKKEKKKKSRKALPH